MLPTEDLISTVILLYIRTHLLVAVCRLQVQLTIASYYSFFLFAGFCCSTIIYVVLSSSVPEVLTLLVLECCPGEKQGSIKTI